MLCCLDSTPRLLDVFLQIVENNLAPTKIASDLLTNLYERSGKLRSWDLIEIIELLKSKFAAKQNFILRILLT